MPIGRPPKYHSDEERRAADAERKRLARAASRPENAELVRAMEDLGHPIDASSETQGKPWPPPGTPTLEAYVKQASYMAELHHSQTSPQATLSTKTLAEQIERAENYATWRYQGYLKGEILTL
jgi:hypothetical protein